MGSRTVPDAAVSRLKMFRAVAAEVRDILDRKEESGSSLFRMVMGYIHADDDLDRLRRLCIPVRRTYLPNDPVNLGKMCELALQTTDPALRQEIEEVQARWMALQDEMNSTSRYGDDRVRHGDAFDAWLDAALFQDFADKSKRFNDLVDRYGKSMEGMAWSFTERMAELVVDLDTAVARALGEPERLPTED